MKDITTPCTPRVGRVADIAPAIAEMWVLRKQMGWTGNTDYWNWKPAPTPAKTPTGELKVIDAEVVCVDGKNVYSYDLGSEEKREFLGVLGADGESIDKEPIGSETPAPTTGVVPTLMRQIPTTADKGEIKIIDGEMYWQEGRHIYEFDITTESKGAYVGILGADGESVVKYSPYSYWYSPSDYQKPIKSRLL